MQQYECAIQELTSRGKIPEVTLRIILYDYLINSDNTKILYMILKPKFMEPEVEVGISY